MQYILASSVSPADWYRTVIKGSLSPWTFKVLNCNLLNKKTHLPHVHLTHISKYPGLFASFVLFYAREHWLYFDKTKTLLHQIGDKFKYAVGIFVSYKKFLVSANFIPEVLSFISSVVNTNE